ncbi:flagellar motor switch protein FliM [Gryllotalpicola daejeonensis]|uniref:Flagellar motor switch protein FliM n=1 Tax=Gryllotalpicola daejeonensis TaxID=993087 RepID=A0ABP7ZHY1_9MICO
MAVLPADTDYLHYDFRRPTTLAREQSRALELAFETFGRQWGTQLTAKTRVRAQVVFEAVAIRTYDDYTRSLPPTTVMLLIGLEASASGARGVLQFPAPGGLAWISRMLGGTESGADGTTAPLPERGYTPVEQAIVRRLLEDTVDDLRYSFGAQLPGTVVFDSIQHNSQFAQAAAPADLMIIATFRVTVGDRCDTATVALPADAILPALVAPPAGDDANGDGIRSQITTVPVQLAVQLTPLPVTAGRVISLAVGDVIRLPHASHKPLDVVVDGVPVARASAGASGSRRACVVTDTEEIAR